MVDSSPPPAEGRKSASWLAYPLMIVATVAVFLAIRQFGEQLPAAAPGDPEPAAGIVDHHDNGLLQLLIALAAVIVVGRLLGKLFKVFRQPPVIGEVVAGILLGPSLLGQLAPEASQFLLPASVAPLLGVVAQLGVILYMFLVGLDLNLGLLNKRAHSTVAISHASIVTPFVLGALLALALYPRLSTSDVPFTSFALFLGVSLSVTAFPVLARILTDRRIDKTQLGALALACAAIDDVTAWCLLAFVVGVAQAKADSGLIVLAMTLAYVAFMFLVLRPFLQRLVRRFDARPFSANVAALVFVGVLASAAATEWIGIHAIFGAFLLGAIIPHDSVLARTFTHKLEELVTVLLLPAFFALTGMRTQIGLVSGPDQWLLCGLIILAATAGKFGGTLAAARLTGLGWRDGSALGVLMNTRGLMELIVLNIGLDLKVISPTLFAMLVLMALVTTIATTPLLSLLAPRSIELASPAAGGTQRAPDDALAL